MSETTAPTTTAARARHLRRAALGLAAAVALWWVVTDVVAADGALLARFSPRGVLPAGASLFASGAGLDHVLVTLQRLLTGLAIAVGVGIPLGVAVGSSRRVAEHTGAVFQLLRMISPLAWTPVAIVILGVGDAPVVFLVAVAAVWPVLMNTAAGVHALDPGFSDVAASLGATPVERLRTVVLPGIRAHIATGVRTALGTAWIVIVPAEMLGVDSGLGYAILDARDRLRYDELMALVLLIGVLGYLVDAGAQRLTRRTRRVAARGARGPAGPTDAPTDVPTGGPAVRPGPVGDAAGDPHDHGYADPLTTPRRGPTAGGAVGTAPPAHDTTDRAH